MTELYFPPPPFFTSCIKLFIVDLGNILSPFCSSLWRFAWVKWEVCFKPYFFQGPEYFSVLFFFSPYPKSQQRYKSAVEVKRLPFILFKLKWVLGRSCAHVKWFTVNLQTGSVRLWTQRGGRLSEHIRLKFKNQADDACLPELIENVFLSMKIQSSFNGFFCYVMDVFILGGTICSGKTCDTLLVFSPQDYSLTWPNV